MTTTSAPQTLEDINARRHRVVAHGPMAADRGAGHGAALTWAATIADPSLPAILYASDLGRPVYERMGYEVVRRWQLWLRPAR